MRRDICTIIETIFGVKLSVNFVLCQTATPSGVGFIMWKSDLPRPSDADILWAIQVYDSKPSEYHYFDTIQKVWVENLVDEKAKKIQELSDACEANIVEGFTSNALGTPHRYQSDRDDQTNFIGIVLGGSESPFKCYDMIAETWQYKMHTEVQLLVAFNDGKTKKLNCLVQYNDKKNLVNAATSVAEIMAIVWEPVE